jgi:hypothetical protein
LDGEHFKKLQQQAFHFQIKNCQSQKHSYYVCYTEDKRVYISFGLDVKI